MSTMSTDHDLCPEHTAVDTLLTAARQAHIMNVGAALDLDRGLDAIVNQPKAAAAMSTAREASGGQRPRNPATDLLAMPAPIRLRMRPHLRTSALAHARSRALAHGLVDALAAAHTSARSFVGRMAIDMTSALGRTHNHVRTLSRARDLAYELARASICGQTSTPDLDLALTDLSTGARKLALELSGYLTRAYNLISISTHDLANIIIHASDLAEELVAYLPAAQQRAHAYDLEATWTYEVIERAAHDFRGADLSEANLHETDLEGVRWDRKTRWPHGWDERIRRASDREPETGAFVVRGEGGLDRQHALV
jgi:hypothetical protein